MPDKTSSNNAMRVRKVPFDFPDRSAGHWNLARPEFSQIINSGSLAMPYLEPYLISSMRQARKLITDPQLREDLDLYIRQEATHFRQHKAFNKTLADAGYKSVGELEAILDADYKRLGNERSLRFNLAYAEGFESMALAIGHMLIDDREHLFGGSDTDVASLILWHFVEEIEHKNVAFDVFDHLYGGYFSRIGGLLYAAGHIFWRTGQGYRALLKEDGLWQNSKSRWQLAKVLLRIFGKLTPKLLKILLPWYHPSKVADPAWGRAWSALYENNPDGSAALDTYRLDAANPLAASFA
ncbi:MAG: metal-dependent hydrolase [Halioglobus sp.]